MTTVANFQTMRMQLWTSLLLRFELLRRVPPVIAGVSLPDADIHTVRSPR